MFKIKWLVKIFSCFLLFSALLVSTCSLTSCSFKKPYMHISGPAGSLYKSLDYKYNISTYGIYYRDIKASNFLIESYEMDDVTGDIGNKDDSLYQTYFEPLSSDGDSKIFFIKGIPYLNLKSTNWITTQSLKGFYLIISFHIDHSSPFKTTNLCFSFSDDGYLNFDLSCTLDTDPALIATGTAAPLATPTSPITTTGAINQNTYLTSKMSSDEGYQEDCTRVFKIINADLVATLKLLPYIVLATCSVVSKINSDFQIWIEFKYKLSNGEITNLNIESKTLNITAMGNVVSMYFDLNITGTYILKGIFNFKSTSYAYDQKSFDNILGVFNNMLGTDGNPYGYDLWYLVPKDVNSYYEYHLESLGDGLFDAIINGMVAQIAHREWMCPYQIYGGSDDEWMISILSYHYKNYTDPAQIERVKIDSLSFRVEDYEGANPTAFAPTVKQVDVAPPYNDGIDYTNIDKFYRYICTPYNFIQSGWDFGNKKIKITNPNAPYVKSLMFLNSDETTPYSFKIGSSIVPFFQVLRCPLFTDSELYENLPDTKFSWLDKPYFTMFFNMLYCVENWNDQATSYPFPYSSMHIDGSNKPVNGYYKYPNFDVYTFPIINGDTSSPVVWIPYS